MSHDSMMWLCVSVGELVGICVLGFMALNWRAQWRNAQRDIAVLQEGLANMRRHYAKQGVIKNG